MGPGGGMFALSDCIGTLVVMGVRKIIPAKPKVEPDDEEERYSDDDQRYEIRRLTTTKDVHTHQK